MRTKLYFLTSLPSSQLDFFHSYLKTANYMHIRLDAHKLMIPYEPVFYTPLAFSGFKYLELLVKCFLEQIHLSTVIADNT
jgi:hypothetical protein